MKKLLMLLLCLALCALALFPAAAEKVLPRLVDDAGLLTEAEAADLVARLDEISARQQSDVVIVTLPDLGGRDITALADDTFDQNGFGQGADFSGILFMISMAEREWAISTCGSAIAVFTDDRQDAIIDAILDDLSAGRYHAAFAGFAGCCDTYLTEGVPTYDDNFYDDEYFYDDESYGEEDSAFSLLGCLGPAFVVGLVAAIIYTAILRGQLKSVRPAASAANYTREGSFRLTQQNEVFLYRNVTRRARQQDSGGHTGGSSRSSSTHRSSSGRSHGGSRGRF